MSWEVPLVVAGAALVGIAASSVVAYTVTFGLIEYYVRHSKYKEYSLPFFPWH